MPNFLSVWVTSIQWSNNLDLLGEFVKTFYALLFTPRCNSIRVVLKFAPS